MKKLKIALCISVRFLSATVLNTLYGNSAVGMPTFRILTIWRVVWKFGEIILQQHLVARDPLDGGEHVVLQGQTLALHHALHRVGF